MRFLLKVLGFTVLIGGIMFFFPLTSSWQSSLHQEPQQKTVPETEIENPPTLSQQLYELNGRGAGTKWEKKAAGLLASYFKHIGLEPLPEYPSFIQEFPMGEVETYWEMGRLRFRTQGPPNLSSQNVIGYLPGQDPEEKWIIFGAHYDGQGEIDGIVYPSANDNLSGVMALAALAKSLAQEHRLNYTLAFVTFGGEEPGLLGSNYLVGNLPVPPEQIQAMINLDTIGKTSDTLILYTTEYNALTPLLSQVFHTYGFATTTEITTGVSDHYPFSLKGIPSVTVATANWKEGNHTAEDIMEELNFQQIGKIAGALKQSLAYLVR